MIMIFFGIMLKFRHMSKLIWQKRWYESPPLVLISYITKSYFHRELWLKLVPVLCIRLKIFSEERVSMIIWIYWPEFFIFSLDFFFYSLQYFFFIKTSCSLIDFDLIFSMQSSEFSKITEFWKYFEKKLQKKTYNFSPNIFFFIKKCLLIWNKRLR